MSKSCSCSCGHMGSCGQCCDGHTSAHTTTCGRRSTPLTAHACLVQDTRPWRLCFPPGVAYFDLDQPGVMQLKQQLLAQAGAQLSYPLPQLPTPQASPNPTQQHVPQAVAQPQQQAAATQGAASHPLTCSSYAAVSADLSQQELKQVLAEAGFQQQVPTVWVAEALLYYLPLPKVRMSCFPSLFVVGEILKKLQMYQARPQRAAQFVCYLSYTIHTTCCRVSALQAVELLRSMARLSAPGSCLLATVVDRELYEADQRLQEGHYFAKMWHFSIDDLVTPPTEASAAGCLSEGVGDVGSGPGAGVEQEGQQGQLAVAAGASWLQRSGWEVAGQPRTTADLAQALHGMGTYVADYGGAECYFWAQLSPLQGG